MLAQAPDDTADTPPGGVGAVADTAPPAPMPASDGASPDSGPDSGADMPVFDLAGAQAEHAAAGTLHGPPAGVPVAAGGIQPTPGGTVVAPVR